MEQIGDDQPAAIEEMAINRISIKPPPFYTKRPEIWFRQMESQFALAGVTSSQTKFHHILTALPEDIVCEVNFNDSSYGELKACVLNILQANRHQRIEEALAAVDIGNKKPSLVVNDLRRKFTDIGLTVNDDIIKSRLLTALPPHIRSALVGHENNELETFAKIADSMFAVAARDTPFISTVSHVKSQNNTDSSPRGEKSQSFNARENIKNISANLPRPFFRGQRPRICNAHIYYASRARSCRPWCQWPGPKPKITPQGQKTPRQSRSSSPVALANDDLN